MLYAVECGLRQTFTRQNVAYASHSRGKITQSVKLNRKNNFINLTNSPLYKPFCSVLLAKTDIKTFLCDPPPASSLLNSEPPQEIFRVN